MKKILIISILLVRNIAYGQGSDEKIIGHNKNEYFVLKEEGYYLVERLQPLKYKTVQYDMLLPKSDGVDTFVGYIYTLFIKSDRLYLVNRNYKRELMKLKTIDTKAIIARNRKHNFFYYYTYQRKLSEYAELLKESNANMYSNFLTELNDSRSKINELNVEDFKNYFDAFLKKYSMN